MRGPRGPAGRRSRGRRAATAGDARGRAGRAAGDVGPLGEARSPELVVLRGGVELREIERDDLVERGRFCPSRCRGCRPRSPGRTRHVVAFPPPGPSRVPERDPIPLPLGPAVSRSELRIDRNVRSGEHAPRAAGARPRRRADEPVLVERQARWSDELQRSSHDVVGVAEQDAFATATLLQGAVGQFAAGLPCAGNLGCSRVRTTRGGAMAAETNDRRGLTIFRADGRRRRSRRPA